MELVDVYEYTSLLSAANNLGIISRQDEIIIDGKPIKQSLSMLYQHSTGACVWGTTPQFIKFIETSKLINLIKNKTVVELGAGTGALALSLSKLAHKVIATDQKPLLKLMKQNCTADNIEVREFDWEKHDFIVEKLDGVVVACDTIYNEYLVVPFCEAVLSVFKNSGISDAIVAVQVRDLSVLEYALEEFLKRFRVYVYDLGEFQVYHLRERTNERTSEASE